MLDVAEIKNLEEKWKRYKRKKNIKILLWICIFLMIIVSIVYYIGFFNKQYVVKHHIVLVKKDDKKITKKITQSLKPIKKIHIKDKTIKKRVVIVNKIKKSNYYDKNIDILHLDKKFLQQIYTNDTKINQTKSNELSLVNSDKNITKQKITQEKTKTKIIISSKKIDKLRYFKEQYKISGKALYALLISKEYYKDKLYKKSLKWAILANSIDSSNEESWIIFAKNKVKLHYKNDAINALRAYLKVNHSKKIENLLFNIKNGVFK